MVTNVNIEINAREKIEANVDADRPVVTVNSSKKPYNRPQLTVYGSLSQSTQAVIMKPGFGS